MTAPTARVNRAGISPDLQGVSVRRRILIAHAESERLENPMHRGHQLDDSHARAPKATQPSVPRAGVGACRWGRAANSGRKEFCGFLARYPPFYQKWPRAGKMIFYPLPHFFELVSK